MKNNIKLIIGILIGILIASTTVYAVTIIDANEVAFNNTTTSLNSTNVQDALDELHSNFIQGERMIYRNSSASWSLNQNISSFTSGTDFFTTKNSINHNFYLKYSVINNTVNKSYIEFTITNELANTYPGIKTGTFMIEAVDSDTTYEINKAILESIFGNNYCTDSTNSFECNSSGTIHAYINKNGTTYIDNSTDRCTTSGKSGGTSSCSNIS